MGRGWNDAAGRLLLGLAAMLERAIASKTAVAQWKLRRNQVVRAAHRRGVPVEVLAERLGLSQGWVRQVLAGRKPPVVEEAA
jgi:hypothetical protein